MWLNIVGNIDDRDLRIYTENGSLDSGYVGIRSTKIRGKRDNALQCQAGFYLAIP